MKPSLSLSKTISIILCLVLLVTNCAFAHASEVNFWKERQRATPLQLLNRLPTATHSAQPANVSRWLEKSFPTSVVSRFKTILSALPQSYGTIRKVILPKNAAAQTIVIHIQDVHMNVEAQKNIGAALQELVNQKKVDLVALEGAFAPIDLTPFRAFPHQDTIHKVADYLLRENKISGPIHAAFTSPAEIPPIVGIDDPQHYQANVEAYRKSASLMKPYEEKLTELERQLSQEKSKAFTPPLSAFDASVQAYRKGALAMGDYVGVLSRNRVDLPPTLNVFLKALHLERSLNFTQVEEERSRLLSKLLPKLKKGETSELVNASVAYRLGNMRHIDFYQYLHDICEKNEIHLSQFSSMNNYLRYVLLSDSIDAEKLFEEIKKLENTNYAALIKTPEERKLLAESSRLHLIGKLLDFSLTKEEWREYKTPILFPSPQGEMVRTQ